MPLGSWEKFGHGEVLADQPGPLEGSLDLLERSQAIPTLQPVERELPGSRLRKARHSAKQSRAQDGDSSLRRSEAFLSMLAGYGLSLSESLDFSVTAATVPRLAIPALADLAMLDLVPENVGLAHGLVRSAIAPLGPLDLELAGNLEPVGAVLKEQSLQAQVRRTRAPLTLAGPLAVRAHFGTQAPWREFSSLLCVPLLAGDQVRGTLTLILGGGRVHDAALQLVAEGLAQRATTALEHARLYRVSQEAIRAREEMLAIVCHDLRNPLNSILLSSSLMLKGIDGNDRRRRGLETTVRSVKQMERLINDLLAFSTLESGRLSIDVQSHDAEELLDDAVALMAPLAQEKEIRIRRRPEPSQSQVLCDRERLLQVLSNVIGNGIKFSPSGTSLQLAVEHRGGAIWFLVRDHGPGIPAAQLPYLFERYWQAVDTARMGRGLGLYIARGIVEAHRGRIEVESVVGSGSTFRIMLPAAALPLGAAPRVPPESKGRDGLAGRLVMVVDDSADIRELLAQMLEESGFEVRQASNGLEALAELRRNAEIPGALLLDLEMPVMSGSELMQALRAEARFAPMRRILLSGHPSLRDRAQQLAADGFITKPVDPGTLLAMLSERASTALAR